MTILVFHVSQYSSSRIFIHIQSPFKPFVKQSGSSKNSSLTVRLPEGTRDFSPKRQAVMPEDPRDQWVLGELYSEHADDHSLPSSAEVKEWMGLQFTSPYAFVASMGLTFFFTIHRAFG